MEQRINLMEKGGAAVGAMLGLSDCLDGGKNETLAR